MCSACDPRSQSHTHRSLFLKIQPEEHFINWQQDPFGNFLARVVFPEPARELQIDVEVIADLKVINPFDFLSRNMRKSFPSNTKSSWRRN
ncbi:MAG: transglutaminase N-terminal domain-containing protein [Gammaproteobacteria bacterium]